VNEDQIIACMIFAEPLSKGRRYLRNLNYAIQFKTKTPKKITYQGASS
jgi:hypothetical protein